MQRSSVTRPGGPGPAAARRYSPDLPWRPRVSPPSVDDHDACAIYASVRKDATASREPVTLALANLQKMLHRAGNVDGEGDGCGILVDIPRKIWAEEVRTGGHNPALARDDAFAVAHVFIERSQDVEQARHDARELLGRAGFRILAERLGEVEPQALGATAREEEPHFWQVGGVLAAAENRDRDLFELMTELEEQLGFHLPSFSATTCVYKVMGAPRVLGEYYPDLRDERFETVGCFGHNRYSTNTWPSFRRVQPFSVLGHNGEINTIEQLRQEARMLGVRVPAGGSDSQDLNRTIDHLIRVEGLSLAEAMEMIVPPVVNEIRSLPPELHPFYMYMREAMGPFAQGPVALIARHDSECVFSADALGLRPLWRLETPDDYIFSSEPGVVSVRDMVSEPLPLGPGEKFLVTIDADKRRSRLWEHAEMQREVARRWLERTGAEQAAPYDRALETGGPLEGTDIPGYTGRSSRAGQGRGPGSRRLRLAARRRQALPADGLQRRRADRLARLRRPARGALARSARTSPTTSRRRSPWSPTRRSTASARWSTSRPAPCSAAGPRRTTRRPTRSPSRPRSRSSSAATTRWRRCRTRPTGEIARDHQTWLMEDLWEEFRERAAAIDIALLESETTAGAIERLKQEAVKRVRDGAELRGAHRPHRLRR